MIVGRFEQQVKKSPNQIAIKTLSDKITYKTLNGHANIVARKIIDNYSLTKIEEKQKVIALLFEHDKDMIIGTIGALKAQTIYVPLDPSYPITRLVYMVRNSQADFIITNNKNIELARCLIDEANTDIKIINIDEFDKEYSMENIEHKICNDDIAYILYTSGSTGKPKGIIQTHRNVLHFIECYRDTLSITNEDRMTLFSAFSHDASVMDIYGALLNGATLYPLNLKEHIGINKIANWIEEEKITIWHSVPTVYRYFVNCLSGKEKFNNLRLIVLGGEKVILYDVEMFQKLFIRTKLINLYGQTESSFNSAQIFPSDLKVKKVTLGKPVHETEILVIDSNSEEVSPLNIGEIVVLSDYIALGYWKDEERSKEVFQNSIEAGKLYRTGDLGKLLLDGSIEFIGRKDSQVKIRGYRIEVEEIENHLLRNETIKETVVLGKKDENGCDYLCAYIVSDKKLISSYLREYLSTKIPDYMIPSYFIQLDNMPLTPNGKIDRKGLPDPIIEKDLNKYEAPVNELQEKLSKLWSVVLGVEKVGINDNFFDLGGNSLKVINATAIMEKELNIKIPISSIFGNPTIKRIEKVLRNESNLDTMLPKIQLELNDRFCWCKLKKFIIENKNYIVLFCDTDNRGIIEYIGSRYGDEYSPNFVTTLKNLPSNKECFVNRDQLLNKLGISRRCNNTTLQKINEINNLNQSKIREYIFRNKAVDKYEVFYMQERFITKKSATINIQEIIIENENNFNVILDAIKCLINENSLFRICLVSEKNKYYFMEFDKLNKLDLNFIDVSSYSLSSVKKIKDYIIQSNTISLQHSDYNEKDSLYRIVIFKETEKDYRIVFMCSHIIFDGGSRSILLKSFYRNYREIKERSSISREVEKAKEVFTYKNYIEDVRRLNNIENIRKCSLCRDYMSLEKEMKEFDEKLVNLSDGSPFEVVFSKPIVLEYKIENPNDYSLKQDELYEGIALYLANVVLRTIFKIDKCVINITTNVRKFNNKNYDNVIGDFHSKLPVVFETNNKSVEYYYNKYSMECKKWYINNNTNLHYMGYGDYQYIEESKKIYELFERIKFHFNFMGEKPGKVENGVKDNHKIYNMGIGNDVLFKMYRIYAYVSDNKIKLLLPSGVPQGLLDELKKIKV